MELERKTVKNSVSDLLGMAAKSVLEQFTGAKTADTSADMLVRFPVLVRYAEAITQTVESVALGAQGDLISALHKMEGMDREMLDQAIQAQAKGIWK